MKGYSIEVYGNTRRTHTWTFYTFETAKGSVTVKRLGESDGDHFEGVYYWAR